MFALMNSEGWLKFIGDRNMKTPADAGRYIEKMLSLPNYYYHVAELRNTTQPVGVITFLKRDHLPHPDFGFAFLPEHQKQGFVYEASVAYLRYLRKHATPKMILAVVKPDNARSMELLTKIGFVFGDRQTDSGGEVVLVYQLPGG